MVKLTQQFAACLRAAGLRVSTSEVLDCLHHLRLIDLTSEAQVCTVLRANFVKSVRDRAVFNRIYHLFFHEMRFEMDDLTATGAQTQAAVHALEAIKQQPHDDPVYDAVADFLAGNPQGLLREMRRIDTQSDAGSAPTRFNFGPLAARFNVLTQISQAGGVIDALAGDASWAKMPESERISVLGDLRRRLDLAREMLLREMRPETGSVLQIKTREQKIRDLGEKAFSSFTPAELVEMREAIDRLVRKLKNIVSRRFTVRDRGALDVKKTLRSAARYEGVPVDLRFRRKAKRKSRIVTLCDVSGSVWAAARFLLNLLYSLQDCFDRVNSFVFVDRLTDVTAVFDEYDIHEAICQITQEMDIHYASPTDYGETLRHFQRNHMSLLTKKTTLIIVGDARSNYTHPEDAILGRMRERCRRVIWLNCEAESLWGTGDSEINTYLPHCHEVRACQNVNQLMTFIEELVL
ncbi:MAG: VWA domain-containing protein [Smithellaceae bacterium]